VWLLTAGVVVSSGCSIGSQPAFSFAGASVDPSYSCPPGADNAAYQLHATIDARNPTSSAVTIRAVGAVLTLAAVSGSWLQHIGDKYDAGNVTFAPMRVGAGSNATIDLTIPSACTNGKAANQPVSYGEYSVAFVASTSAGTLTVTAKNKHRITTT
jgi:hypothetical protein